MRPTVERDVRKRAPKTYVFDLDGTICVPNNQFPDTHRRYRQATPVDHVVAYMRRCRADGIRIVIHTARRMVTHGGDVTEVIADVGQVTRDWLARHDVPYDDLVFGKPYGDVYVDDKAVRPEELPR